MNTYALYLTDKSGKRFWNTLCGVGYGSGERHNLERHLAYIKSRHPAYAKCQIDPETAVLVDESPEIDMSADAIAAWLAE